MKRVLLGALAFAMALPAVDVAVSLACGSTARLDIAHAAPKKKGPAKAAAIPQSPEIAKTMGELKWGTSRDEVHRHFADAIQAKYKPILAKAGGALEEDKQRSKMKEEMAKLKSSQVDFNGRKTGWDVSFLKGEFTHNNGESLLVVSDANSENYFFFIQNKLWKWYKAFKTEAFEGKNFDQFAAAIQQRFGPSQKREGEAPQGGKQAWLEWQDETTRLRAIDNSQFYGFYSLVFEDKNTLAKLPQLRANEASQQNKSNSFVDAVTSDEANNAASDNNPDVMDRITGKIRHRQEAPAGTPTSAPGKKGESTTPSAPTPAPSESGGVSKEDDPLEGLGL